MPITGKPAVTEEPLFQKAVKGGFWVVLMRISQQLLAMLRLVILARLLAPEDFGLLGIALLTLESLAIFTKTGFRVALIQKQENTKDYLDAAWTIQVIRGIILFVIVVLAAPWSAYFFDRPDATAIIRVIGLSFLLSAFSNIGVIYFVKELDFRKQYIRQIISTLTDITVSITIAIIYKSVWALVLGRIARDIVSVCLSYMLHPYRPRFCWDRHKIKNLWSFGKWVLGASILGFLLTQGDDIFVGKLLGTTVLGFYLMAYKLSNMPATEITHVFSQVTFPVYAKIQNDIPRLKEVYLKVLQFTALLSFPIAGLIFVLSPDFVTLFLKEKWIATIPIMKTLVFFGLIRSLGATTGPVFQAVGRPIIITTIQLVKLPIMIVLIFTLTKRWGISGTAMAVLLSAIAIQPIVQYMIKKIIGCSYVDLIKMVAIPLSATLVMAGTIFMLKFILLRKVSMISFFILAITGILIYTTVVYGLDRWFKCGVKEAIKEQYTTIRK